MNNPFHKLIERASRPVSVPAPENLLFPPNKLTPEESALVAATNAELSSGIAWPTVPTGTITSQGNLALAPVTDPFRKSLKGGTYEPADELLIVLNSHYFIAKVNGAYVIAQIEDDGSIKYISDKDFRLKLGNIFVRVDDGHGGKKKVSAEKFWISHPNREEREVIFDPKAPPGISVPGKYNLWGGFAVTPKKVTGRQRRIMRHLFEVICQSDRPKFKYLISWLAWAVQNPDRNPQTAIVSRANAKAPARLRSTSGCAEILDPCPSYF